MNLLLRLQCGSIFNSLYRKSIEHLIYKFEDFFIVIYVYMCIGTPNALSIFYINTYIYVYTHMLY